MIRTIAILAALTAAGPANAVVIAVQCTWNVETQRIGEHDGQGISVFPYSAGGAYVTWDYGPTTAGRGVPDGAVLQNCENGDYLITAYPANEGQARQASDLLDEMIYGAAGYTLRQMGEGIAQFGAGARIGNGNIGNCGCDAVGY
jgi:hypothetical protein